LANYLYAYISSVGDFLGAANLFKSNPGDLLGDLILQFSWPILMTGLSFSSAFLGVF